MAVAVLVVCLPWNGCCTLIKYFRWHPFDVSTEAGRSAERYRMALWSVLANVLAKGVLMVVMVLSVRWTLPYLGEERMGVWMAIASLASALLFLDLGVGNALTNRVAGRVARGSRAELVGTISGGVGLLVLIGVGASALLLLLALCLPWQWLIKVSDPRVQAEVRESVLWFAALFGAHTVSTGVQKIFSGLQRAFEAHAAVLAASLLSLLLLWWAASARAGIAVLLLVTLGAQACSGLVLVAVLQRRGLLRLRQMAAAIQAEKLMLLKTGGLFLLLQVGTMVAMGADSLLIASSLGAAQVAVYGVAQRLFQFVSNPLSMVNAPLWPAYADAMARHDRLFIQRTLQRSMRLTAAIAAVGAAVLGLFSGPLVAAWTRGGIILPLPLVLAMCAWTVLEAVGNCYAMMMNGCGIVREQVVTVLALVALALPAKLLVVQLYGVAGMVAAYAVVYCVVVGFFYGNFFKRKIANRIGASEANI